MNTFISAYNSYFDSIYGSDLEMLPKPISGLESFNSPEDLIEAFKDPKAARVSELYVFNELHQPDNNSDALCFAEYSDYGLVFVQINNKIICVDSESQEPEFACARTFQDFIRAMEYFFIVETSYRTGNGEINRDLLHLKCVELSKEPSSQDYWRYVVGN